MSVKDKKPIGFAMVLGKKSRMTESDMESEKKDVVLNLLIFKARDSQGLGRGCRGQQPYENNSPIQLHCLILKQKYCSSPAN